MTRPDEDLVPLLSTAAPTASIHVDVSEAALYPQSQAELRRLVVVRRLEQQGAEPADVAVLLDAFAARPGVDSPVGLVAIARHGRLVVEQLDVGRPPTEDAAAVTDLPDVVDVLRARESALPFELVEARAQGGRIRSFDAPGLPGREDADVRGTARRLHVPTGGGNAHHEHAHAVEDSLRGNAARTAQQADAALLRDPADDVVVTGDPHVSALVDDELAAVPGRTVTTVRHDTSAPGAPADWTDAARDAIENDVQARRRLAIDALLTGDGRRGAIGLRPVIDALQQARAGILLLPDGVDPEVPALLALETAPWVASTAEEAAALGAAVAGSVPTRAALARAAVLIGALVLFPDPGDLPGSVAATLRWSEDPE